MKILTLEHLKENIELLIPKVIKNPYVVKLPNVPLEAYKAACYNILTLFTLYFKEVDKAFDPTNFGFINDGNGFTKKRKVLGIKKIYRLIKFAETHWFLKEIDPNNKTEEIILWQIKLNIKNHIFAQDLFISLDIIDELEPAESIDLKTIAK